MYIFFNYRSIVKSDIRYLMKIYVSAISALLICSLLSMSYLRSMSNKKACQIKKTHASRNQDRLSSVQIYFLQSYVRGVVYISSFILTKRLQKLLVCVDFSIQINETKHFS